ncbi:MAG: AAA family ATPase [Minicystis sp.]
MTRIQLPLVGLLEDSILPGEERAFAAPVLDGASLAALARLAAQPDERIFALTITSPVELPSLVSARWGTECAVVAADGAQVTLRGVRRGKLVSARGKEVPYRAEVDIPDDGADAPATGELVTAAHALLAALDAGALPDLAARDDRLRPALLGVARAVAGADMLVDLAQHPPAEAVRRLAATLAARAPGEEASCALEQATRETMGKPELTKALRHRLWAQVVEIQKRLDVYDPTVAEDGDDVARLQRRLSQAGLHKAAREAAKRELRLLRSMQPNHHDYSTYVAHLDFMARLPWQPDPPKPIDLDAVQAALDRGHAGLEKAKRRVLEFLAVRALGGESASMILCLSGPPGVGKTSIARAMAEALGRPFVRVPLGGVHDESEIRGHRLSFVAASAGRILKGIAQAGSASAVVLLDEIDKIGTDQQRSPMAALLEVLDPEQNAEFQDNYLGVPFDLSHVLFVATANETARIHPTLLDRMEPVEIDGYTANEKSAITRDHLLDRIRAEHGLPAAPAFAEDALALIIEGHTRESGVRQLRRALSSIFRARALELVRARGRGDADAPDPARPVTRDEVAETLGPARFAVQRVEDALPVGVATGLSVGPGGGFDPARRGRAHAGRGRAGAHRPGRRGPRRVGARRARAPARRAGALRHRAGRDRGPRRAHAPARGRDRQGRAQRGDGDLRRALLGALRRGAAGRPRVHRRDLAHRARAPRRRRARQAARGRARRREAGHRTRGQPRRRAQGRGARDGARAHPRRGVPRRVPAARRPPDGLTGARGGEDAIMAKTLPNLATAAEIRALAARAMEVLEAYPGGDDDDRDSPLDDDGEQRENAAFEAAREALRFCAAAAAQLGDAGLLPLLVDIVAELGNWDDHAYGYRVTALRGVTTLLRAGAPVDGVVEALAEHEEPQVRAAVALGLAPAGARASAILAKLALDPNVSVRRPAKAALAATGEVSWWTGKFESDPIARLTPEEALRHKETLEALSALLDQSPYMVENRDEKLAGLVGALPDPLAVEAARLVLAAEDSRLAKLTKLGAMMIARPGGIDAFLRVCEAWGKGRYFHASEDVVRMIADTSPEIRLDACLTLARYAATAPEQERTKQGGPVHIAAQIAGGAFPPGADLTPLLDLILAAPALPERTLDWSVTGLRAAFVNPAADPTPIAARLVEAQLAGFPGRWDALHTAALELLRRLPRETLRAAAEEAVRRDDDQTVAWGLARLLSDAHDPEVDPDPLTMVRRFWEEPRLRQVMMSWWEMQHATISLVRDELRRGVLPFTDAARTVDLIDALWGGRGSGMAGLFPRTPEEVEKGQNDLRARYAAFLGPPELQGPVTDDEWAALRRARAALGPLGELDFRKLSRALMTLPSGPWHPDDRALLDRAVAVCEAGDPLGYPIAMAICAKPDADLLPLFQRLVRLEPDQRDTFKQGYFAVREALGLPPPVKGESAAGGASAPREWMDEPEDDEDDDDDE